jgi:hypothetical protein
MVSADTAKLKAISPPYAQAQSFPFARFSQPVGEPIPPFHASNRIAFIVTSTLAPVPARMADQRPVTPMMVVTRTPP